ncbi:MAG: hypothetical protein AAFR87_31060, partial [Bacteroidota bacterium]
LMNDSQELNFPPISPTTHHVCNSRREGDWIIFTCPKCPRYIRKYNWKTRKMIVKGDDDLSIRHMGTHLPFGVSQDLTTQN